MIVIKKPSYKKRLRLLKPKGLCVHTSGRTIVERAASWEVPAISLALEHYRKMGRVHACIDYDGVIYQTLDWNRRGPHVGISKKERRAFLNGTWETIVLDKEPLHQGSLALWHERFPEHESPAHLYGTKSPNDWYIGIEMIPLLKPLPDGSWYTPEQYAALSEIYAILADMFLWDTQDITTLVGHECLDPFGRWFTVNKKKKAIWAWDPGALRSRPRFLWDRVNVKEKAIYAEEMAQFESRAKDLWAIISGYFRLGS